MTSTYISRVGHFSLFHLTTIKNLVLDPEQLILPEQFVFMPNNETTSLVWK